MLCFFQSKPIYFFIKLSIMKRSILFLLSICVLLFSCSDGDDPVKEVEKPPIENKDPFITLKNSNIDFTNKGGSESITIESNVTWTAKSSASWCTVSPTSGSSSTTSITLSAPANEDYDTRSCTVTIESGNITKTITVNQGENLGLLITQDRYELGNEESTIAVEVKANVDFEVEINDEWITQVETRGLTTSELEFKIAKNDTYGNREGSITIKQKGGNMSSTITIFQSQEDAIILSEKEFDLSSAAQSIDVEIKTNIDYEIIIPEEAKDWVTHSKTRALRTETVVLDIAQNKDYDDRTAKIIVKDKKTNLQETVTIKQAANLGLIVSEDKYELTSFGGTIDVEVKANVEFGVDVSVDWITQVDTRGLNSSKLSFDIEKNNSYDDRDGEITFYQKNGKLSTIVKVIQSKKSVIILSENVYDLSNDAHELKVVLQTNIDFEIIIPEKDKDWVSHTPTRGLRDETVLFNIAFNKKKATRTASISIKDKETNLQEFITINQEGEAPHIYWVESMGSLNSSLNQTQKDTITTMIVKGEINKADFDVMKLQMPKLKYVDLKDVVCKDNRIPDEAFGDEKYESHPAGPNESNKNITSIVLPESVEIIGKNAFRGCTGLTGSLKLPESLIKIENDAFYHCYGLTGSLIIPEKVTTIGERAFCECFGFNGTLSLPRNLTAIERWAFMDCKGFTGNLIIPDGVTTIKYFAFYQCSGFTGNLILPDGLTDIEEYAFALCEGFTGSLVIPENVRKIDDIAFISCTGFSELVLGNNIESIGERAFNNCKNIKGRVAFPLSLKELGGYSFYGCDKVEAFRFPHTYTYPNSVPPRIRCDKVFPFFAVIEVPEEAVSRYKADKYYNPSTNYWTIVGY